MDNEGLRFDTAFFQGQNEASIHGGTGCWPTWRTPFSAIAEGTLYSHTFEGFEGDSTNNLKKT